MKGLEKQLEFEFMKEERKQEKLIVIGSLPEWITAICFGGTLATLTFYDRVPSVYETLKEYIKSLF